MSWNFIDQREAVVAGQLCAHLGVGGGEPVAALEEIVEFEATALALELGKARVDLEKDAGEGGQHLGGARVGLVQCEPEEFGAGR